MRVLYLVTRAELGGAQVHILDLLRGFRSVLEPTVAVGEEGYFTTAVRELGMPIVILPSLVHPIAPMRDIRALAEVVRLIRTVRPDIVHAHTSKAGIIARIAARATGVPAVFTAHTWCFAEGTSWKWRLAGLPAERLAGWFSEAIINVSNANRDLALRHGVSNEKKMLTIWNGIPETSHRARPGAAGVPRLVMVARCAEQKDHSLLLRAFARIAEPSRLTFVGRGPKLATLQEEASQLNIGDRVEFLGDRFDIAEILAASHVFVLATKWEGFPLSILEAMRAGLPVIASNVGGIAEAVTDEATGFLVERGDVFALQNRLHSLIADPALRRRMGAAGRQRYESSFTLDHMLRKTLAVYQMAALGVRAATAPAFPLPRTRADF